MNFRVLWPLALLAVLPAVRAQIDTDGPVNTTPDFALAMPLVQVQRDVMVKFPVLINFNTVLKPGMVLRNLYVPPIHDDGSEDLAVAHMGNMEQSYARDPGNSSGGPRMAPELAHELERQRRIVWAVPINFQLALAQLPTDELHLIYSTTGRDQDMHLADARFDLIDGLFLGSPTEGITILAVEAGSTAAKAGCKAGDQILSAGGEPVPADLAAFPAFYFAVRKDAEGSHATSFPLVVRSPGETGSHTLSVPTPPTIKSMLMQGF